MIVGVQQLIKLRAIDFQTPRHFNFGNCLHFHHRRKLEGQHAPYGLLGRVVASALLTKKVFEELTADPVFFFNCHFKPPIRFSAV